jgi:hypothetical protein
MKGRRIYGDLVPFGQVWRAGANEATTFVTSSDVVVGGKTVAAGSYTIFTIPAADKWTLIVNKKTGEWGIPYKYESDEAARVYRELRYRIRQVRKWLHVADGLGNNPRLGGPHCEIRCRIDDCRVADR